jgi:hypothetical protein
MQWFQLIPGALMLWLGVYYVYCYIKKKPIVRKNHPMPVTVGHLLSGVMSGIVGLIFIALSFSSTT